MTLNGTWYRTWNPYGTLVWRALIVSLALAVLVGTAFAADASQRLNIIWALAEDASPHIGAYGERTIQTPNLDRMAAEGVRFQNAFVTNPVCSPSRSAMVSGMFQTTLGAHNHRSANTSAKAGGNEAYYDSYRVPESIKLIPELFTEAGYYVVNGGKGKTDYNFIERTELYRGKTWSGRAEGQPFFAQIQLQGGKARKAKVGPPADPAKVKLPPYYPDDPVLREDWAEYLNTWVKTDNEIGALMRQLDEEGIADSTVVFFWTDHGISHLRGKQFLYDEGIHVPLIVRFPKRQHAGTVRTDLVSHIDVAAASLDLAGIPIPGYVQGRPLFAKGHQERNLVYAARDRCDETTETIRAVRDHRYKCIRNFRYFRMHMQPNQYKYGKEITQTMFRLHREGKLNELQDRIFQPRRPVEELYDLRADPNETVNLAGDTRHAATLKKMRNALYQWMISSRDMGIVPEPILEDLGKKYGSKYDAMRHPDQKDLIAELIRTCEADGQHDAAALLKALSSPRPAVRYWAALGLGNTGDVKYVKALSKHLDDANPTVRVAAARSIGLLTSDKKALESLAREIDNPNVVVGLYAIRALEEIGDPSKHVGGAIAKAKQNKYDTTRRIAQRLSERFSL